MSKYSLEQIKNDVNIMLSTHKNFCDQIIALSLEITAAENSLQTFRDAVSPSFKAIIDNTTKSIGEKKARLNSVRSELTYLRKKTLSDYYSSIDYNQRQIAQAALNKMLAVELKMPKERYCLDDDFIKDFVQIMDNEKLLNLCTANNRTEVAAFLEEKLASVDRITKDIKAQYAIIEKTCKIIEEKKASKAQYEKLKENQALQPADLGAIDEILINNNLEIAKSEEVLAGAKMAVNPYKAISNTNITGLIYNAEIKLPTDFQDLSFIKAFDADRIKAQKEAQELVQGKIREKYSTPSMPVINEQDEKSFLDADSTQTSPPNNAPSPKSLKREFKLSNWLKR